MRIVFLFVDGLGLRAPAGDNPVNPEVCPSLCRLVARHGVPIDACLGVPGLPQSATGQSTMFTGENASAFMNRHCEGFPGPALREFVAKNNLFLRLKALGKTVKFANAYLVDSADEVAARRFKSVTTVMALSVPETIATADDLADDEAVAQDLTRETLLDRYPDMPAIAPEEAGEHLFSLALGYDFTLFEFFQTDVAGHSSDYARACGVLRAYDAFLGTLMRLCAASGVTVLLTSDHGNVEALGVKGHTRAPVPFVAYGPGEGFFRSHVKSLVDVTPAIVEFWTERPEEDRNPW